MESFKRAMRECTAREVSEVLSQGGEKQAPELLHCGLN